MTANEHLGGIHSPIVTPWPTRRRSKLRLETTIPTAQPKKTLLNDFATQKNIRKYPNFSPFTRFTPHKEQNPWRTVGEGTVLSSRSIWVRTLNCFATETKNYAPECWKRDCAVPACGWSSRLAVWWTFAIFSVNFKWENTHQGTIFNKDPSKREVRKIIIHSKVPNGRGICDRATQSWPYNQSRWSL